MVGWSVGPNFPFAVTVDVLVCVPQNTISIPFGFPEESSLLASSPVRCFFQDSGDGGDGGASGRRTNQRAKLRSGKTLRGSRPIPSFSKQTHEGLRDETGTPRGARLERGSDPRPLFDWGVSGLAGGRGSQSSQPEGGGQGLKRAIGGKGARGTPRSQARTG